MLGYAPILDDIAQEDTGYLLSFATGRYVSESHVLLEAINHNHDGSKLFRIRQACNEVHSDAVPRLFSDGQ